MKEIQMPRGVPKSGFRASSNSKKLNRVLNIKASAEQAPEVFETDAQIEEKLSDRFDILEAMTTATIEGDARAFIVSGPAGLGKSFTVEKTLADWDPSGLNYSTIKGYIKAPGLYKLLYANRAKGQVLVFDDADEVFLDDTAINLLKAACDTSDLRRISYITEGTLIDEETTERLPKSFEFEGSVIFITNYDFDSMIERGSKLAPHLEALVSRAHYLDLAMKSKRDYIIRIRQVVRQGLLSNIGLDVNGQRDVVDFLEENQDRLRELSLRMALKVGVIRRRGGNWLKTARVLHCKN
jgi:hypothetical protein